LIDIEMPAPEPRHHDLLVEVKAVSVNPVDVKIRRYDDPLGVPRVLGFDAAGIVRGVGSEVTHFGVGDEVYYAGIPSRPGSNAEFQLVDERIVGRKPKTLSYAEAAALPLTGLTAWEMLFERFKLPRDQSVSGNLLIIGGAGGVGSIAIQLARRLTGLTVIATASRPETLAWCRELGAHHVIDHAKPLREGLRAIGVPAVDYVFSTTQTERHFAEIVEVAAPQGKFGLIDDPKVLDALPFKRKAVSIHWEFMFARPVFETPDMIAQHRLLTEVAGLVDDGLVRTTLTETMGKIDAATLKRAHALIESGRARGKLVLAGF